jgi:CheY-like chemotaxis protein
LFAIAQAQGEEVTLKVDASTDAQTLVIKLRYKAPQDEHYWQQCQTLIRSDRTIESFPAYDESLLSLAICVLLIRHQSGTLSLVQTEGDVYSIELAMTVPVEVTTQSERRFQAHKSLHDRRIWIAGFPAYGTRALEAELKSWGLEVDTFSVEEHVPTEAQYDFGLYNVSLHHVVSPPWLTQVIGNTQHDVAFLYSPVQSQLALAQQFAATTIRKPWLRRSLHRWLVHQLQGPEHIAISAAAQARLAQAKVLLVSTDSALTQQLEHIFVPHGAILKTAHNVASFQKQTHQMTFDMILMDVEQTQLSYHEMTADFRQREREQHIEPVPIVTLSSGQHDSIVLHGLMFGADQLTKPLQTEHLFDCLERFWG